MSDPDHSSLALSVHPPPKVQPSVYTHPSATISPPRLGAWRVGTKTIKYRTYELDIREPTERYHAWSVVNWPPNRGLPIVVAGNASEAGATAAAKAAVDKLMGGPLPPE